MAEGDRWPDSPTDGTPAPELQIVSPDNPEMPAPVPSPPKEEFPAWSFWDVLVIPAVTVVALFVCSAIALGIAHAIPAFRGMSVSALAQEPFIIIGSQIASYPIVIAFIVMLVHRRTNEPFLRAIRWNWPGRSSVWFYLLGFVLAFSVQGLSHFLPIPKSLPMDKFFNDAQSAYLMAFFGVLVAPVLEELFFRGMLYPTLRRRLGVVLAVTLTAAAFAAIHGTQLGYAWAPILSIFVVGVALTLVRELTGSVAAGVLTHSGYNFTLFTLLWIGSSHFHHLEKLGG